MTNFEYYKEQIQEIGLNFGIARSGKLLKCFSFHCVDCAFNDEGCGKHKLKWLYSEHKEQPKLTKNERRLCEILRDGYVKRDKKTPLWSANKNMWWVLPVEALIDCNFPFIKEDEEMWRVEDLLKLEVEE